MISIVIADDEPAAVSLLERICLDESLDVDLVGTSHTIDGAIRLVEQHRPDLLLLDVEFPEGTGFEVLEGLSFNGFHVVFITAHENYAIKAIKHHAFDYLLKPINADEVTMTIRKVIEQRSSQEEAPSFKALLDMIQSDRQDRFPIPITDGYRYIDLGDLIYIKADGSYAHLYFADGSSDMVSKKLAWFEERLSSSGFLRVHRSYLINKQHIAELHRAEGGYINTSNGERIPTSKGYLDKMA